MEQQARLSKLERVNVRQAWVHEAHGFTPWLAQEENLQLLARTLQLSLTLEAQEQHIGTFKADILAKDTCTGQWVLIENQLERTDHSHLGQLITYASGIKACTIIWIAESFTNEHRAALDWLNENTGETLRFFGVEIEVWRIGSSPFAPKFNIIAKPNDWARTVARTVNRRGPGRSAEIIAYILNFVTRELREPTLNEIMIATSCAKQTAVDCRRLVREEIPPPREIYPAASRVIGG